MHGTQALYQPIYSPGLLFSFYRRETEGQTLDLDLVLPVPTSLIFSHPYIEKAQIYFQSFKSGLL